VGFADWWSNFTEPIDHEASADFANDAYAQAVAADMSNGNYDFDVGGGNFIQRAADAVDNKFADVAGWVDDEWAGLKNAYEKGGVGGVLLPPHTPSVPYSPKTIAQGNQNMANRWAEQGRFFYENPEALALKEAAPTAFKNTNSPHSQSNVNMANRWTEQGEFFYENPEALALKEAAPTAFTDPPPDSTGGGGGGGGGGGAGGGADGDGGPDTGIDVGDGDPDAGDTGPDPAGEETPVVEVLVKELFTHLVDDATGAYVAAVEFYDERENVLGQNILDMEALRRAGIVDAAEAQRKALLELQRTRTERLRLDEIAATGRLGELEGFRRTQEQNVSDRIRDRGAGVRSDFDSRIATAEAALAALGITSAPELDAAGSLGGALLDSQAGSQQALTDRFRVANEHAAVDRGMNLQGTYQQAAMALADYLWDANRQNDAAEQAGLQGLSEGVLGQQQELENTLANSRFSAGQDLRSQVGAFDPVTGQQINPMGGSLGAQNYAQLIQMRQEADAKAEAEAQRQAELARQAGFYGSVGNYMGLNEGAAQGFGETGLLPSLFDSLYGSQSGSSYENMVPVEMANGGEYFVDPMQYLKYQQDVANSQPLNLVPIMFQGQQIMVPIDKATDPRAIEEYLALAS